MKIATRVIFGALSSSLIIAVGLVPVRASAAQTWQARAGSGFGNGLLAAIKYYPQTITIDEGDSITWTVEGDAHTISFLSGAPAPDPLSPQAQLPAGGTSYNGSGFVNSGLVDPGGTYTLTFPTAGTYTYNCLLHPGMSATVIVQPANTPYPHQQRFYDNSFIREKGQDIGRGTFLLGQILPDQPVANNDGSTNHFVTAGIGNGTESVFRFSHKVTVVHEGDTVTWTNRDPMMPHTVTFPGSDGQFQDIFTPVGGKTYDGSILTSSGILMANQTYTLQFTKAGRYDYECLLHDQLGMKGTVVVLRNH